MYIITWSEKIIHRTRDNRCQCEAEQIHKAMTCSLPAMFSLFQSLTKDQDIMEVRIRDDAGNLVPGGFFQKA